MLGGARTLTVAGTANEFHIYFPPCISAQITFIVKKLIVNQTCHIQINLLI